ncbi:hypothetical protein BDV19DRAFT_8481 [Aspergillus venezuelensis]
MAVIAAFVVDSVLLISFQSGFILEFLDSKTVQFSIISPAEPEPLCRVQMQKGPRPCCRPS